MAGIAMASSTSTESPLPPRSVELASVAEQSAAIDELIGLAQRRIRVFDQDLSHTGWNLAARTDRLIVHDTHYIESACPRLLGLLRTYSFAVTIYRTGTEARLATDPLIIVDDRHYLHRFHFEQSRAAMGINQPDQTRPLAARFEEIWATGEPGLNATVLGL